MLGKNGRFNEYIALSKNKSVLEHCSKVAKIAGFSSNFNIIDYIPTLSEVLKRIKE